MKFLRYTAILILSFLIGTTIGEILRLLVPDRYQYLSCLTQPAVYGFEPVELMLRVINIKIGLKFVVNVFSWLGIFISAIILSLKEVFQK